MLKLKTKNYIWLHKQIRQNNNLKKNKKLIKPKLKDENINEGNRLVINVVLLIF